MTMCTIGPGPRSDWPRRWASSWALASPPSRAGNTQGQCGPVLEALQRLAPAVLRHLIAYGELLCEETGDALRQSRRRALGLAVTVAAGVMALALACLWAIAASWDGPNRLW